VVENFPKRIIICASGNSVSEGLEKGLEDYLQYEYSIGLNMWYKFGPETTFTTWIDWEWYRDNLDDIKNLPLLIGKIDPSLSNRKLIQDNTITLKPSHKYHGKNSWEHGFYKTSLVGYFALTLSIALNFKEIYLLGYDGKEIDGKTHFYQDKVDLQERTKGRQLKYRGIGKRKTDTKEFYKTSYYNNGGKKFHDWFLPYKQELDKIKIVNVSSESIITTFPKINYDEFFKILKGDPGKVTQELARDKIRKMVEERKI